MDRVLVVEDRKNLRDLLVRRLEDTFEVVEAADGATALQRLAEEAFAVVVTDVKLPGASGDEVLRRARERPSPPEVVLMTAYAEVPAAVAAMRAGAYDYLAKPFEPDDLVRVVRRAAERRALVERAADLEALLASRESGLLGDSEALAEVRRTIDRVGPLPVTVLVEGETGTGKEVVAKELAKRFGDQRLVAVNCSAIPEALLEAELFGVAKGAFTGAVADRAGLFEQADGGTLFLDEIGDLPLALQVKLNRVLEEGELRRLGEARARAVRVRVVGATHRPLEAMVAEGAFRADLYYRLRVVRVVLPPLRERARDVAVLAAHFLRLARARFGTGPTRIDPDALAALERWRWPGNVRELRHAVEAAVVTAPGDTLTLAHLPEGPREAAPPAAPGTWREAVEAASERAGRDYLVRVLERTGGNITHAARLAGVERESMHRLLRRHGLDPATFRDPAR